MTVRQWAEEIQAAARKEAARRPDGVERARVVSTNPLVVESFHSDAVMAEGDEGFQVAADRNALKAGDEVLLLSDRNGERVLSQPTDPDQFLSDLYWHFVRGGFRYSRDMERSRREPYVGGEGAFGGLPEPGNRAEQAHRYALNRIGAYLTPDGPEAGSGGARLTAPIAVRAVSARDTSQVRTARGPSEYYYRLTGSVDRLARGYPAGYTTTVARDFAPGASEVWLTKGKRIADQVPDYEATPDDPVGMPSGVTYQIAGISAAYTSHTNVTTQTVGAHPLLAEEVRVADATDYPAGPHGGYLGDRLTLHWEGKERALDATAQAVSGGIQRAGSPELRIEGDPGELAAMPPIGSVAVQCLPSLKTIPYDAVAVAGGVAVLTLEHALVENVADDAPVWNDLLTGVTSEFEGLLVGVDKEDDWFGYLPGTDYLVVNLDDEDLDLDRDDLMTVWGAVPASGYLRTEEERRAGIGPVDVDRPTRRIAFTSIDPTPDNSKAAIIRLAEPLDFRIEDGALIRIEGIPGLSYSILASGRGALQSKKLLGVTWPSGPGAGGVRGEPAEFSPRWRGWDGPVGIGGHFWDRWAPQGWDECGHVGMDIIYPTPTRGINSTLCRIIVRSEKQDLKTQFWRGPAAGLYGSGVDGGGSAKYKWAVGGPQANLKPPTLDLIEPPDDDDSDDPTGDPTDAGFFSTGTLFAVTTHKRSAAIWPSPTFWPDSRRLTIQAYNVASNHSESRDFTYSDYTFDSFTGFAYPQDQAKGATLVGDHALPASSLTVVDAGALASAGKLRAKTADGLLVARFLYGSKVGNVIGDVTPGGTISFADLARGLVPAGWWRLGDASGTSAVAEFGSTGTYAGGPTLGVASLLTGSVNTAAAFNTGNLSLNQQATFPGPVLSGDATIVVAFKWNAGWGVLKDNTGVGSGWTIGFDNAGTFAVRIAGTLLNTSKTTAEVRDGNRHLLAVRKTGAAVKVFLDGAEIASAGSFPNTAAIAPWHLARQGTASSYSDVVADEPMFFTKALSDAALSTLYTAYSTGPLSGGSGTVPGGSTIEEDYGLGDMWFNNSANIILSDAVAFPFSTSKGGAMVREGKPGQIVQDLIGPNRETGTQYGLTTPLTMFRRAPNGTPDGEFGTLFNGIESYLLNAHEKGQPNGVATLDSGGRLPAAQLTGSVVRLLGTWNAATNTPTLADGTGTIGDQYIVAVGAVRNLGSGAINWQVGDTVLYDGAKWVLIDRTDLVVSVNGATGVVVLTAADVGAQPFNSNLAAIAALSTTSFGRSLLEAASAAAARTLLGAAADTVDAAQGTGSLRTLGTGHQQAAAGDDPRFAAVQGGVFGSSIPSGQSVTVPEGAYFVVASNRPEVVVDGELTLEGESIQLVEA